MRNIRFNSPLTLVVVLLLLSMACSNKTGSNKPNSTEAKGVMGFKGNISKLRFGQTVALGENDLSLVFTKVTNDSRCPKGGECIQQGNVYVELRLEKNNKVVETFILSDLAKESRKEIGNILLELKSVSPHPEINKIIDIKDYVIVLEKSKKINQGNH